MSFWLLIVGGSLLAVSFFVNPRDVPAALGLLLFVAGLLWFCVGAFATARREGTGVGRAAIRAIHGALRLTWKLMP